MQPLASKVALVTGAARRIGSEIARTLHSEGMNIVVHYNSSKTEALCLCQELNLARPNSAIALAADLTESHALQVLAKQAYAGWQRLDVLINNASRFYKTKIGQVSDTDWHDLINSNLKAPFFLSQAVAPFLTKTQGSIINITDIHGQRPLSEYSAYCISKSGLLMATKVLAKELAPAIRVNAISPGSVDWPEGENALTPEQKQQIIDKTALLRPGSACDIAKAVLFFIRDAGYITGQVLQVDGGRALNW